MSTSEGEIKRKMHPALHDLANCLCALRMTDGFCAPINDAGCKCWDSADRLLRDTGLSSQALQYVITHRREIEDKAARGKA